MKKIKIMSMLLGGLLVLGSLTACGGDDSTTTRKGGNECEGRL